MNQGHGYEAFVSNLQRALINSESICNQENIKIELNKKVIDNCGIAREFDLYWEYSFAGIIYKTAIECKDYNRSVGVEKIDSLIGKLHDLPDIKPVFATKIGYQRGAQKKAKQNRIELLIVREQNDNDWFDKDGNPYIKRININMVLHSRINITGIRSFVDKDWVLGNTSFTIEEIEKIKIEPIESAKIEDAKTGQTKSLMVYFEDIDSNRESSFGHQEAEFEFDDAYFFVDEKKLKIKKLVIEYDRPKPYTMPMTIDYTQELIGVIEYLSRKQKVSIFKNGTIVKEDL